MPRKTVQIPVDIGSASSFNADISVPFQVTSLKVYANYMNDLSENGVTLISNKLAQNERNILACISDRGVTSGPWQFEYETPLANISGQYKFELLTCDGNYTLSTARAGDLLLTLEFSG